MPTALSFEEKLATEYGSLSAKLRDAADYVATNQLDVATRSLRSVSATSGLAPATFSRLARALDFDSYEELREMLRSAVGRQVSSFSEKVTRLQAEAADVTQPPFLQRQSSACATNIETLVHQADQTRLNAAVDQLHTARHVHLLGALGSTGIVEYLSYMANFFTDNWMIVGRMGASLGAGIANVTDQDALIIITKPPFAKSAIRGAEMAAKQGAYVIVITDTHTCPALAHASASFIVPTDSPQFFSSYAATLVLAETLIGMLVARAGHKAQSRIADVGARNRSLGELWDG